MTVSLSSYVMYTRLIIVLLVYQKIMKTVAINANNDGSCNAVQLT